MGKSLRVLGGDELGVQDLIGSIIYTCSNWPMAMELNRSRIRNMAGIVSYLKQKQKGRVQSFYAPSGEYIVQEDGVCDVVLWLVDAADIRADTQSASTPGGKIPTSMCRPRDRLVVAVKNLDANPAFVHPSSKVANYLKYLKIDADDASVAVIGIDALNNRSLLRLVAALDAQSCYL